MSNGPSRDAFDFLRVQDTLDTLLGMVEAASENAYRPSQKRQIPTVIVSGFLGSGKTTLLRHVLSHAQGKKIAVLVNDFAALNVDAGLVRSVSNDVVDLANGCVCCSLSGGVARAIRLIAQRAEPVDAIMIEASGVADPVGIAHAVHQVDGIRLDSIIAIVDASVAFQRDAVAFLERRQISGANLVLLNKVDLIDNVSAQRLEAHLRNSAPKAQVLRTQNCAIPLQILLSGQFEHKEMAAFDHDVFTTLDLRAAGSLDPHAIELCFAELPDGIFRVKGQVSLKGSENSVHLLQAVGRRWTLEQETYSENTGRLVAIGLRDVMETLATKLHFKAVGLDIT